MRLETSKIHNQALPSCGRAVEEKQEGLYELQDHDGKTIKAPDLSLWKIMDSGPMARKAAGNQPRSSVSVSQLYSSVYCRVPSRWTDT